MQKDAEGAYLFRRQRRNGPKQARTAEKGPRVSAWWSGVVGDVLASSALLKSWITFLARGSSQLPGRARGCGQVERQSLDTDRRERERERARQRLTLRRRSDLALEPRHFGADLPHSGDRKPSRGLPAPSSSLPHTLSSCLSICFKPELVLWWCCLPLVATSSLTMV
ncbi:hypothetical protein INR49_010499 [Caranx melampygus]|nr:hypothetical protein INR49_010499 [Caranx melampygus]